MAKPKKNEPTNPIARAVAFVKDSWAELKKVHWPDRPETTKATLAVVGMIIFFGIFLGVTDMLLGEVVMPLFYTSGSSVAGL